MGVYAEQDARVNASQETARAALEAAGLVHEIKVYPGVDHAFFNDTGARYNPEQADQAYQDMLAWFAVTAGDFFYVPAGTVHAMGPGLSLVEVQQNTDITYRLYDYGRPRELHLDAGLAVAHGGAYPTGLRQAVDPERARLMGEGPQFRLAQFFGMPKRQPTFQRHRRRCPGCRTGAYSSVMISIPSATGRVQLR